MRNFHTLKVWEKSHAFSLAVYKACKGFPPSERYGLTSQLQRAALSIPTNIAEGCGRDSEAQFARFLEIAPSTLLRAGLGSASESDYLLLFARDMGWLSAEQYRSLNGDVQEIKKMLFGLLKSVGRRKHA
ncbi:four helix bundle protein [Candidatus Parcubacteria bacterium]|nr:MAG: four helix bundle protein [Candidatus Parcubacteria bacterium]